MPDSDSTSSVGKTPNNILKAAIYAAHSLASNGKSRDALTLLTSLDSDMLALIDGEDRGGYHLALGVFYNNLGNLEQCYEEYQRAMECFTLAKSDVGLGMTHTNLANNCRKRGDIAEAREHLEHALHLFEKAGKHSHIGLVEANFAVLLHDIQQFDEAGEHYRKSIAILEDQGVNEQFISIREQYAKMLCDIGDTDSAIRELTIALECSRESNLHQIETSCIQTLGCIQFSRRMFEEARELYQQALVLSQQIKNPRAEGTLYRDLAHIELLHGNLPAAYKLLESSEEVLKPVSDPLASANVDGLFGRLFLLAGCYTQARSRLIMALEEYRDLKIGSAISNASNLIGITHLLTGDVLESQFWLESAAELNEGSVNRTEVEETLATLLVLFATSDQMKSATKWSASWKKLQADQPVVDPTFYSALGNFCIALHTHTELAHRIGWKAIWDAPSDSPDSLPVLAKRLFDVSESRKFLPGDQESILLSYLCSWLTNAGIQEHCFAGECSWSKIHIVPLSDPCAE